MSAEYGAEFREEYEIERDRWLRSRFLRLTRALALLAAPALILPLISLLTRAIDVRWDIRTGWPPIAWVVTLVAFHVEARRRREISYVSLLRRTALVVAALSVVLLTPWFVKAIERSGNAWDAWGTVVLYFVMHAAVCEAIPLSRNHALLAGSPLAVGYLLGLVFSRPVDPMMGLQALAGVAFVLPGLGLAHLRRRAFARRFERRIIRERVEELDREIDAAGAMHAEMLPSPVSVGEIRLSYAHEPGDGVPRHLLAHWLDTSGIVERRVVAIVEMVGSGIGGALRLGRAQERLRQLEVGRPGATLEEVMRAVQGALGEATGDWDALCVSVSLTGPTAALGWLRVGDMRGCVLRGGMVELIGTSGEREGQGALHEGDTVVAWTRGLGLSPSDGAWVLAGAAGASAPAHVALLDAALERRCVSTSVGCLTVEIRRIGAHPGSSGSLGAAPR